jgi:hypothetical protein
MMPATIHAKDENMAVVMDEMRKGFEEKCMEIGHPPFVRRSYVNANNRPTNPRPFFKEVDAVIGRAYTVKHWLASLVEKNKLDLQATEAEASAVVANVESNFSSEYRRLVDERPVAQLKITIKEAFNLKQRMGLGKKGLSGCNPYVVIKLDGRTIAQTHYVQSKFTASWNFHCTVPITNMTTDSLCLQVFDHSDMSDNFMGEVWIKLRNIIDGRWGVNFGGAAYPKCMKTSQIPDLENAANGGKPNPKYTFNVPSNLKSGKSATNPELLNAMEKLNIRFYYKARDSFNKLVKQVIPPLCRPKMLGHENVGLLCGVGDNTPNEKTLDGWYNLMPRRTTLEAAEGKSGDPPTVRGFLRVATAWIQDPYACDNESGKLIPYGMAALNMMKNFNAAKILKLNSSIKQDFRKAVPLSMSSDQYWAMYKARTVRERLLSIYHKKRELERLALEDQDAIMEALYNMLSHERAQQDARRVIGSVKVQVIAAEGLLQATDDGRSRRFKRRVFRSRLIGTENFGVDEQTHEITVPDGTDLTNPRHTPETPFIFDDEANESAPVSDSTKLEPVFKFYHESMMLRIECIDKTEKKMFDASAKRLQTGRNGSAFLKENWSENEYDVGTGFVTIPFYEIKKMHEAASKIPTGAQPNLDFFLGASDVNQKDPNGNSFYRWLDLGPDVNRETLSTMQLMGSLKKTCTGRVLVKFEIVDVPETTTPAVARAAAVESKDDSEDTNADGSKWRGTTQVQRILDSTVSTKQRMAGMLELHSGFARKIRDMFHHEYMDVRRELLGEIKTGALPAQLKVQVVAARGFRDVSEKGEAAFPYVEIVTPLGVRNVTGLRSKWSQKQLGSGKVRARTGMKNGGFEPGKMPASEVEYKWEDDRNPVDPEVFVFDVGDARFAQVHLRLKDATTNEGEPELARRGKPNKKHEFLGNVTINCADLYDMLSDENSLDIDFMSQFEITNEMQKKHDQGKLSRRLDRLSAGIGNKNQLLAKGDDVDEVVKAAEMIPTEGGDDEGIFVGEDEAITIFQWYPLRGLKDHHESKGEICLRIRLTMKELIEADELRKFSTFQEMNHMLELIHSKFERMEEDLASAAAQRDEEIWNYRWLKRNLDRRSRNERRKLAEDHPDHLTPQEILKYGNSEEELELSLLELGSESQRKLCERRLELAKNRIRHALSERTRMVTQLEREFLMIRKFEWSGPRMIDEFYGHTTEAVDNQEKSYVEQLLLWKFGFAFSESLYNSTAKDYNAIDNLDKEKEVIGNNGVPLSQIEAAEAISEQSEADNSQGVRLRKRSFVEIAFDKLFGASSD